MLSTHPCFNLKIKIVTTIYIPILPYQLPNSKFPSVHIHMPIFILFFRMHLPTWNVYLIQLLFPSPNSLFFLSSYFFFFYHFKKFFFFFIIIVYYLALNFFFFFVLIWQLERLQLFFSLLFNQNPQAHRWICELHP